MKTGKFVWSFSAKDDQKVILRTPKQEDLDDLLEFINSLVEEKADILRTEKVSREEEIDWLSDMLDRVEKDDAFYLVAEVDGKVIANSEISRKSGCAKHVGVLGIAIRKVFGI